MVHYKDNPDGGKSENESNQRGTRVDGFVDDLVRRKSEELPTLRIENDPKVISSKNTNRFGSLHDQNVSWKKKVVVASDVQSAVKKGTESGRMSQRQHSWARRLYTKMHELQMMFGLGEDE